MKHVVRCVKSNKETPAPRVPKDIENQAGEIKLKAIHLEDILSMASELVDSVQYPMLYNTVAMASMTMNELKIQIESLVALIEKNKKEGN